MDGQFEVEGETGGVPLNDLRLHDGCKNETDEQKNTFGHGELHLSPTDEDIDETDDD